MLRQVLRTRPQATIFGRYSFFTSNVATHSYNQKIKETNLKINTADYLYHSLSGFDLFKLVSILENGILSKASAESRGIKISSHGRFENGENRISVSTHDDEALFPGSTYAGDHLSVIIDPKGLAVIKPLSDKCPLHERQIHGQISKQNIVGVMLPEAYCTKDLRELHVFNLWNKDMLKINMNNLDRFLQIQYDSSILSDPATKNYYDEAMALERGTLLNYFYYKTKLKQLSTNLNASIMQFIADQHKLKLGKLDITAVDIIHHHTKDKYPLFKLSGGCINPLMKDPSPQHCYAYSGMKSDL